MMVKFAFLRNSSLVKIFIKIIYKAFFKQFFSIDLLF